MLSENRYFEEEDGKKSEEYEKKGGMPSVLQNMISDGNTIDIFLFLFLFKPVKSCIAVLIRYEYISTHNKTLY